MGRDDGRNSKVSRKLEKAGPSSVLLQAGRSVHVEYAWNCSNALLWTSARTRFRRDLAVSGSHNDFARFERCAYIKADGHFDLVPHASLLP